MYGELVKTYISGEAVSIVSKTKKLLDTFLEKNAISKAQYDKSLHDLREKMGEI